MAMAEPRSTVENAQMSKVADRKYKYTNTDFKRVTAKMYDYNCDVKLKIGDQTFRAHKDVLSDASIYFSAMFGHDMREKEQASIEFHEISPQGFTCMLEYFYHGHITLDPGNIEDVIESSGFFQIEWLIRVCCDFLIRHLSLENYENALSLADKYFLGDLRKDIFRFITLNFTSLSEQRAFTMISYDLFHQLLADNHYIEATEDIIFRSVLKWLYTEPSREVHFVEMLKLVRYPLLDNNQLMNMGDDILTVPELKKLVDEAIEYQAAPNRQPLMVSEQTESRGAHQTVTMFSALDDAHLIQYKIPGIADIFSEEIDTSFLHLVFEFSAIAELGNFIFVVGGYKRDTWCSTNIVYRYNPRNREWGILKPMHDARVSFALCSGKQGLYAVGGIDHHLDEGRDTETILDTVEYYDPMFGNWRFLANLPVGAFSSGACVDEFENLYVSGGISANPGDDVPTKYFRKLPPGEDFWVPLSDMLTERQGHVMTFYNNRIYAIGGYTCALDSMTFEHCLTMEYYEIETDQWSMVEVEFKHGHIHGSMAVIDNRFYLLGGEGQGRMLITFDPETEKEVEEQSVGELVTRILPAQIAFPMDEHNVAALFYEGEMVEDNEEADM